MTQTIVRLFDHPANAVAALTELKQIGVPKEAMGLVAGNQEAWADSRTREGVDAGLAVGGMLGASLAALMSVGALAIPGAGAAVAAGFLFSLASGAVGGAAVGAAAGGLIAALRAEGVPDADGEICLEAVRRGGAVVIVRCESSDAGRIRDVLQRHGGAEPELRGQVYREAGWIGFDDAGSPYGPAEIADERARAHTGRPPEPASFAAEPALPSTDEPGRPQPTGSGNSVLTPGSGVRPAL